MPGSPTRTRPSTAGKTTSTTTSASTQRARTLPLAASSILPTDHYAPADGTSDGMTSEVRVLRSHTTTIATQRPVTRAQYRTDRFYFVEAGNFPAKLDA